jgi:hypothetical protein
MKSWAILGFDGSIQFILYTILVVKDVIESSTICYRCMVCDQVWAFFNAPIFHL